MQSFRALALSLNVPEILVAEACQRLSARAVSSASLSTVFIRPSHEACALDLPFQLHEVEEALRLCNKKSAPGADRIGYIALVNIGGKCEMLVLDQYIIY